MLEIRPQSPIRSGITDVEPPASATPGPDMTAPATLGGADPLATFGAVHGFHPGVALYGSQDAQPAKGATAGTPVYDVAKVTPAEIQTMKESTDPVIRKLGITIENAKAAYAGLIEIKVDPNTGRHDPRMKILVTTSAGNGGDPVMVVTGPKFDPARPARVITFYHGDNATVADPIGSKAGINTRIRSAIDEQPQTVFVLPEARRQDGKPWHPGTDSPHARDGNDYKADWGHVQSQARTTDDALAARGITLVGSETVAVHSRGGSAIAYLMARDPSGKGLRATSLELYDSLYGSQAQVAQWAGTANGKAVKSVVFYRGNIGAEAGAPIARAFRDKYWMVDLNRKVLGAPENKPYRDAEGHTVPRVYQWEDRSGVKRYRIDVVRDFHEDPHYKTTGVFLGRDPGLNVI